MNNFNKIIVGLLLLIIDMTLIISIVGPEIVNTYTEVKIDYSFYLLIKWIIFLSSFILSIIFYYNQHKFFMVIAILVTILFNPFNLVFLYSRDSWIIIDILLIVLSILYFITVYLIKPSIPKNKPQKLVNLLSNFTIDTPIKYTTHSWDFGSIDKVYTNYQGFLNSIGTQWEGLEDELKFLSPNLHEKIHNFLLNKNSTQNWCSNADISIGWSSLVGLEEWCNNGNSPFNFQLNESYKVDGKTILTFGDVIVLFKREIEIRNENNMLENIFMQEKKKLGREFKVELIKLKGRSFYTDVEKFRYAIEKIFEEIQKREEFKNIKVEVVEPKSEYMELKITQLTSTANRSAKDMLNEVKDGDFKMLKDNLKNLCDWSIESSYEDKGYRVNYLRDSNSKEIEKLNDIPQGFTHILRFYK